MDSKSWGIVRRPEDGGAWRVQSAARVLATCSTEAQALAVLGLIERGEAAEAEVARLREALDELVAWLDSIKEHGDVEVRHAVSLGDGAGCVLGHARDLLARLALSPARPGAGEGTGA